MDCGAGARNLSVTAETSLIRPTGILYHMSMVGDRQTRGNTDLTLREAKPQIVASRLNKSFSQYFAQLLAYAWWQTEKKNTTMSAIGPRSKSDDRLWVAIDNTRSDFDRGLTLELLFLVGTGSYGHHLFSCRPHLGNSTSSLPLNVLRRGRSIPRV